MGFIDKVKEFYFELEDGYYNLLDGIEKHFPIYKIIDPIDRVVPSYPIMALLSLLVLGAVLYVGLGAVFQGANAGLTVRVVDADQSVLPNVLVNLTYSDGHSDSQTTDDFGEVKVKVPKGSTITVSAAGQGLKSQSKSVTVAQDGQTEILTLEKTGAEAGAGNLKTIRFLNQVGQPISDELRVVFTCKSPYATPPEPMTVSNGKATVTEPAGCGQLIATVSDSGSWANLSSVAVDADVKTIYMEAAQVDAGRILVNLTSDSKPVSGVDVDLYRYEDLIANPEVGPVDSTVAYDGQATFNKPQGIYVVKAYDSAGNYGTKKSDKLTVLSGQTATVNLELANNVKGKISIRVLDRSTKNPVSGALVTLRLAADDTEIKTLAAGSDGVAAFNVSDDVDYRLTINADGYVQEKIASARISATTADISLTKCSASTCGLLNVQVVDEEGVPVSNATVALYVPETNFVAGYTNQTSDANGMAGFGGVKPGTYYAFGFREFGAGRSNDFRFGGGLGNGGVDATVTMQVGKGTLLVNTTDKDGKPIPFPQVTVYSTLTNGKIGSSFGDANGVFTIDTKADKEIYVSVAKDGYATYVSSSSKIENGGLTRFTALLEPRIIDRPVEVKFLGLFKGDRLATNLAAGEDYVGKWQLRIPENLPYTSAGIHIRTGDDVIMEKDDLYVKGVNAPGAAIIKSTAYDPKSGLDQASYDYTYGDAKWLNATWANPRPGIYEVQATVQVRKTASVGRELNLYYRAWGTGTVLVRDPADDFIETNELYDNTYKQTYQVGASTLCDQDFCFDASIHDFKEDLVENVVDTYQAQVFTEYEMTFTLTNNSKTEYHTNGNLRISNPDASLLFTSYTINDADGKPHQGNVNGPEFPRIDVGNLAPNKRITGKFRFATQRAINGVINVRLVSDQQIAFDKYINVAVAATNQLNILLERNTLSSGIDNDLVVNLVDSASNLEVPNATCRLKDRHDNVISTAKTDAKGRLVVRVPAQLPGTALVVECEKEKFDRKDVDVTVTDSIVDIQPQQLSVSLNAKSKPEGEVVFHVRNLTNFPLKIASIELAGNFKNLLDEQQMRNWLVSNYKDFVIQPGQTLDATFKAYLSDDGKALTDRADLDGKLIVTLTNFGQTWSTEIPARVGIGLSGDVDVPGCLTLTRDKWETTTEGNPVNVEFQIQNNCTINGQPVPLRRLEAQLALSGNQLGEYKLTVGSSEVELRSAYSRAIVGEIGPSESLNAILTFTPYGGTLGEAKADISLSALNPKEEKDQQLTSKMATSVAIVNIKDCVSIDKHLIAMPEKGNGTFTVSTKKCGGKTSFQLASDLELSLKEFVLDADGSQQVQVLAGESDPGQYGVIVKSKAQNEKQEQLIRNVRVRVDSEGCLSLSKYEFDVLDKADDPYDGYDNAQLINKCVEKEVTATIDTQDLMASLKKGATAGLITLGVGLIGQGISALGKKLGIIDQCKKDTDCPAQNNQEMVCQAGKCVVKGSGASANGVPQSGQDCVQTNVKIGPNAAGEYVLSGCIGRDGCYYNGGINPPKKLPDDWQPNSMCKGTNAGNTATVPGAATGTQVTPAILALFQAKQAQVQAQNPSFVKVLNTGTALQGAKLEAPAIAYNVGNKNWLATYNKATNVYDDTDITGNTALLNEINGAAAGTVPGAAPPAATTPGALTANPKVDKALANLATVSGVTALARFDLVDDALKAQLGLPSGAVALAKAVSGSSVQYLLVDENGKAISGDIGENNAKLILNQIPKNAVLNNPFGPAAPATAPVGGVPPAVLPVVPAPADPTKGACCLLKDKAGQIAACVAFPDNSNKSATACNQLAGSGGKSFDNRPCADPTLTACVNKIKSAADIPALKLAAATGFGFNATGFATTSGTSSSSNTQTAQTTQSSSGGFLGGLFSPSSALLGGLSGGTGGLISTILGAATGEFGIVGQAMTAFLGVTLSDYLSAGTEDIRTIQKDVETGKIQLYAGFTAQKGVPDTDIEVKQQKGDKGKPIISSTRDPRTNSRTEKQSLVFTNKTQFTTEPENPKVKYLVVEAKQHNYDEHTVYQSSSFDKSHLKEDAPTNMNQKFRVQFNAIPPEANIEYNPELLNCQSGVRSGRTGVMALPKVKFDWSWSAIAENDCDSDNPAGIFCDATQFSIALLKKLHDLDTYMKANAPFTCPSQAEPFSTKTATIGAKDIGVSRLAVNRTGNDQNVSIELTNNNPGDVETSVKAYAVDVVSGKTFKCSPDVSQVKVSQTANVACLLQGLPNGTYRVRADLLPNLACPGCQNNPASDNLEVGLVIGDVSALQQCTPYSTDRLAEFLAASGKVGGTHANALTLASFHANLIKDRYTSDFQKDFDQFSKTQAFFEAPSFYKDGTDALSRFFSDPDRFTFKPRFGDNNPEGYLLPSPGVYDVTLNVVYDKPDWRLSDGNKLTAHVEVLLDRLDSPDPDSPFYHLPFDGLIGANNGRVGYGVNYKGDKVRINSEPEALYTVEIPGSTPVQGGIVEAFDKTEDFKRMNIDRRGTLLEVSSGPVSNQITYSPSFATPVILKMTNNADQAWAFYSLSVGDTAANVGPSSSKWNGIGYNCASFDDRRMLEGFQETPDQHGLETACAVLGGDIASTSYGFEFCKPLKYGNVFLKTVYYTPQSKSSKIQLNVANDAGELISQQVTGSLVPLSGVQGMPRNQLGGSQIGSVEDIFNLVKDEFVCVSGSDSRADFWWNPKKILDAVKDKEDAAQQQCIKPS